MIILTPPASIAVSGYKVFLGGAIDMGAAVDWQAQVIDALRDLPDLVLFNPRRPQFTAEMQDEQIRWELAAMQAADAVLMWFPKNAQAPIALLETGLYLRSGKLLLGVEAGYHRARNLELTATWCDVPLYDTLSDLLDALRHRFHT